MENELKNDGKTFHICPICQTIFDTKVIECSECGFEIKENWKLVEALENIISTFKQIKQICDDDYEKIKLDNIIKEVTIFKDERRKTFTVSSKLSEKMERSRKQ